MKNLLFLLLLLSTTAMISCKGDQGDPGPAGVMGQDGTNGIDGLNGNANIKSFQTRIMASDWVSGDTYTNNAIIAVPILTMDIVNNGLIMVYFDNSNSEWIQLPVTSQYGGIIRSYFYEASIFQLKVINQFSNQDPWDQALDIRVIAATADGLARNPDLDWSDYKAVKAAMDLAD